MKIIAERIYTPNLVLDPLTLADMDAIFAIAREKNSIEDFQFVAKSIDDVKTWLEPSYHDPDTMTWMIKLQKRIIGLFEVCLEAEYSDWDHDICRIGYFLDWREQRKGYATEALLAVIDWVFNNTDIKRIEAGVTCHNTPSYRILEKAGFICEKIVKANWKWYNDVYDSAYYFLLKPPAE